MPMDPFRSPDLHTQALERRIAGASVINLVTSECVTQKVRGVIYYDTRPMVDPREHSPANVDWHAEVLAYGLAVGILQRDTTDHHLVRFIREARS